MNHTWLPLLWGKCFHYGYLNETLHWKYIDPFVRSIAKSPTIQEGKEIAGGGNDARTEDVVPDPVRHDPGGEWLVRASEPFGEALAPLRSAPPFHFHCQLRFSACNLAAKPGGFSKSSSPTGGTTTRPCEYATKPSSIYLVTSNLPITCLI